MQITLKNKCFCNIAAVCLFLCNDHLINTSTCQNNSTWRTENNHVVACSIWWEDSGISYYSKEKNLPKQNLSSATLQTAVRTVKPKARKSILQASSVCSQHLTMLHNCKSFCTLANASAEWCWLASKPASKHFDTSLAMVHLLPPTVNPALDSNLNNFRKFIFYEVYSPPKFPISTKT